MRPAGAPVPHKPPHTGLHAQPPHTNLPAQPARPRAVFFVFPVRLCWCWRHTIPHPQGNP